MSVKVKNILIKVIAYLLSGTGMALVAVFQYFSDHNPMPTWLKVTIPCMIALLILFLVYYKALKQKINRKLTAIETAKELGKTGETNAIIANLLEVMGIIIPLALISGIFVLGGQYLVKTGTILFEMLGMYLIIVIGNVCCDINTKEELKKKELEKAEELTNKIADKINNLPKKYE